MRGVPISRSALAVVAGGVVVVAGAVVGWRLVNVDSTYDPATPLDHQCGQVPDDASRVVLRADDGIRLGAAVVGPRDAQVGVVLRQGAGQTICDWLSWAGEVAARTRARVLLFDRRGHGSTPGSADLTAEPHDLADAVGFLRRSGVRQVAVVGSSMGNSITFAALGDLPARPCALVAISPVLVSGDSGGTVDGRARVPYPSNIWITWEEQNPFIGREARRIETRARRQHLPAPHLHGVDTHDHSIVLVEHHRDVREFVLEAIRSCSAA
jgi:pimeloyl-ACP methyl ester carboxylesterase